MFYVWTRRPSRGARLLAKALKGKVVRPDRMQSITKSDTVINWGDSGCQFNSLNNAAQVAAATNKRAAFHVFQDANVPIPRFAATRDAVSWDGMTVVRHKLTGHSGEGIELCQNTSELPDAPLYVEYVKKEQEFRIHVGRKKERDPWEPVPDEFEYKYEVFSVQRKARRRDVPDERVNWQVRNHANGFIYARGDANPPPPVTQAAIDALEASGLDFGAVDVIYNEKSRKAYVLEINTAPGLEGQTVDDYKAFFSSLGRPA